MSEIDLSAIEARYKNGLDVDTFELTNGEGRLVNQAESDLAALIAEVKKLRLACDIAESGEEWWKGIAINSFVDEEEGKRVVEELDRLRKERDQAGIVGKREMLDLLHSRLLIGPSDYDNMMDELDGKYTW